MESNINKCYVYIFRSNKNKDVEIDGIVHSFKEGDVYYVGEGNENRIKHMTRSLECNMLTEQLNGKLEIVRDNLTKEEVLIIENELIKKYKKIGYIANKDEGQKNNLQKENIPIIKFLIELDRQGIIEMSYNDLERETNTSRSSLCNIQDSKEYISAIPVPPDNFMEILEKYKPLEEENKRILGEMKYILELIDNNLLNMSSKDLYEGEYNTYHEKVKVAKEFPYKIRPSEEKLMNIINKYGFHVKSEKDLLYGKILSCLNLKNVYNLKITDLNIANLFNVNLTTVTDIKRRQRKNVTPIDLDDEMIGKLFSIEKSYLIPDSPIPKNEKFEWIKDVNVS